MCMASTVVPPGTGGSVAPLGTGGAVLPGTGGTVVPGKHLRPKPVPLVGIDPPRGGRKVSQGLE